jgi:hypothetical protein
MPSDTQNWCRWTSTVSSPPADRLVDRLPSPLRDDQEAVGRKVGLPFGSKSLAGPVHAPRDWLSETGITGEPIFRTMHRRRSVKPNR